MSKKFMTVVEAEYFLADVGHRNDAEIDIFECALAFAFSDFYDADIQKYRDIFTMMVSDVDNCFQTLAAANNSDDPHVMTRALKQILIDGCGYHGDDDTYDDLKNMNIIHVMERRMGIPITLSILAIALCRAQGWFAQGINFPGHFLMCLEKDGDRVIVDPFDDCKILDAKDLRILLKKMMGETAELSATHYESCDNRETLIRLQNNIKYRLIDAQDYQGALKIVMQMSLIAPKDARLNLDKAVLFSRIGQTKAAIENIEVYLLSNDLDNDDRAEAEDFLFQLKSSLN
jgi:regulator of sirC expression with transglutaminase-like and TPR domain